MKETAMTQRSETAAAIWPNLATDRPAPQAQPQRPGPLAAALYPNLVPKPKRYSSLETVLQVLREHNAKFKGR
jgi:hypothetical protein